ncbi:diphosphoinositol-polyphosphate diphosphatase [Sarracenia purpurea var. burkii]
MLEQSANPVKKLKTDTANEDMDILVSGVCSSPVIALPGDVEVVEGMHDVDELINEDDHAKVIADIWGLPECSMRGMTIKDEETHFYSKLLDALKIYHLHLICPVVSHSHRHLSWAASLQKQIVMLENFSRAIGLQVLFYMLNSWRTMPGALEGSFNFFKLLPSNPLTLPTILQQSLISLLMELLGCSSKCKVPVRTPSLMYKNMQPFINLLLYSPIQDIKDQAYILAQAAMLSTGAFDKNPSEIGAWFLFLPGYSSTGSFFVGDQGVEVFQNSTSVVFSFFCDVVSTIGNNLIKYWDLFRCHTYRLKCVEGNPSLIGFCLLASLQVLAAYVSPEFSPFIICVLEKCLRVLSSKSGTFSLPEKSVISLYVSNTIKYLLQTQVETGLLCSLVDLLLSKRIEDNCSLVGNAQDLCEWRPLKNLLIFSRGIENRHFCCFSSIERKVAHADCYCVNILDEVKRVVSRGSDTGLVGATDNFISSVLIGLFWFHQIQLLYRTKPLVEFEQLSGSCSILIENFLAQLKVEQLDSGVEILLPPSSTQCILESARIVLSHPVLMLSLECPLTSSKDFTEEIFGDSLENFHVLARLGIHKMDHHVLNLLTTILDHLLTFCSAQRSLVEVDQEHECFLKAFKALVKKLNLIFRDRFDRCIKIGDLKPLAPTLYVLHALIHLISPLELLELVLWMFSRIDHIDSTLLESSQSVAVSVGLWIAGCAFDMLSAYLQQPYTKGISYGVFWGLEEKSFDVLLFENIYFQVIEIAMRFELDVADLCLQKAVNIANKCKITKNRCLPLSMDVSRVILSTPIKVLSYCIQQTSMTRANILFLLTEVSPFHLSVFGRLFSDVMNKYSLSKGKAINGTFSDTLSDDNFVMLLPTALLYLNSTSVKNGEPFAKFIENAYSFYGKLLLRNFSNWKSYVSGDMFKVECTGFLPSSMEELLNLLSDSLLGKSILMLRYYFASNGDALKLKKRLKFFVSVCPCSSAHDDLLDGDVSEIDAYSLDQSLNLVNRLVAKIYFCSMILFPMDNKEDESTKEIHSEMGSNKEHLSRIRFMNVLVQTWELIIKKFPSNSDYSGKVLGPNYFLFRFLEGFILRNILELTREMRNYPTKLNSLPFIEQLARSSLLYRFGDPATLKMLRGVLYLLSEGNLHILVLQLLLGHSQFAPTILSVSQSSVGSQFGVIFRPMESILRLLTISSTDRSALGEENSSQKTSDLYIKQLEVVKLLRTLLHIKVRQCDFDLEKDIGVNSRELLFLLLSSYGATLDELDLEIYNLMLDIESANEPSSGSIAEMDYLWGSAAIRIRKEREEEQVLSSDKTNDVEPVEDRRRSQFRENLPIDPKMCAYAVLHFPYDRTVGEVGYGNSGNMVELHYDAEKKQTYDPVFILRFAIHSLSMDYIEPMEFASLGLLAIAFVSISSPDDEMRKLGYEVLGRFRNALEIYTPFILNT